MNQEAHQEIDMSLEEAKQHVAIGEAISALFKDPNFQMVFVKDYLEDEPIRLSKLLGDSSIRANERAFASTVDELKAVGLLDNHLRERMALAREAAQTLAEYTRMQDAGELDEESDEE